MCFSVNTNLIYLQSFLARERSRTSDIDHPTHTSINQPSGVPADLPTHISVNQPSRVPATRLTGSGGPPVDYYAVCEAGINPQLPVSDQPMEDVDLAPVESDDHMAWQDQLWAESQSPPDYNTYMREYSQEISGHTNLSYVIDNPVFDPINEPPPPSYSDVITSDPDQNMPAESPPEHRTVVDITMDPEYVVCLPSISQRD